MHELSLAVEVIELASREAAKHRVFNIREILIEVGDLSGVEADAFRFGLEMLVKDSILEQAEVQLVRTPGKGRCASCNMEFEMKDRLGQCPLCQGYPSEITGGQEFRVLSFTGNDT